MAKKSKKGSHGSAQGKRVDPGAAVSPMTVHVNKKGVVSVTPDGGNALAVGGHGAPVAFEWTLSAPQWKGSEFQLRFSAESWDGLPDPGTPWPFVDKGVGPNGDLTPWGTSFSGDVTLGGAFKYTVYVRDADKQPIGQLDPKIIIGRV